MSAGDSPAFRMELTAELRVREVRECPWHCRFLRPRANPSTALDLSLRGNVNYAP